MSLRNAASLRIPSSGAPLQESAPHLSPVSSVLTGFPDPGLFDPAILILGKTVDGTSAGEYIETGGGADRVFAIGGNDVIWTGGGGDYIEAGSGADYAFGDLGNDTIHGEAGADTLLGGAGNDYLSGGSENDSLYGDAGRDTIIGGTGSDLIAGGDEADTIFFGDDFDWVDAGAGNDVLIVFAGADDADLGVLLGGAGADTIVLPNGTALASIRFEEDFHANVIKAPDRLSWGAGATFTETRIALVEWVKVDGVLHSINEFII
jgi:Ca2+-binding RTX toxin-like protein